MNFSVYVDDIPSCLQYQCKVDLEYRLRAFIGMKDDVATRRQMDSMVNHITSSYKRDVYYYDFHWFMFHFLQQLKVRV